MFNMRVDEYDANLVEGLFMLNDGYDKIFSSHARQREGLSVLPNDATTSRRRVIMWQVSTRLAFV
jgi:hypothetical protein